MREVRSFKLNDDIYVHYQDLINFLNEKEREMGLDSQIRWDLDKAIFERTH